MYINIQSYLKSILFVQGMWIKGEENYTIINKVTIGQTFQFRVNLLPGGYHT